MLNGPLAGYNRYRKSRGCTRVYDVFNFEYDPSRSAQQIHYYMRLSDTDWPRYQSVAFNKAFS